jgi:hypothetical protein
MNDVVVQCRMTVGETQVILKVSQEATQNTAAQLLTQGADIM